MIFSCEAPKEPDLKFKNIKIEKTNYPIPGDSSRSCSFTASVPVFESGNKQLIDSINTFIAQTFFYKKNLITDLEKLVWAEADSFYQVYLRDFSEFNQADFPLKYEYNLNQEIAFHNNKYVTLKNFVYEYMGGNHGNYGTRYYMFDAITGERITINKLVSDTIKLQQIAQQEFYKMKELNNKLPINDQGFWFEKNVFHLNNNFGLINDTLVFTYNPYEITSYAEGQIDLKIPMSNLK